MEHRLLCTCPSRGRPRLLKRMLESFLATKGINTDVAVYLDDDDLSLGEYKNELSLYNGCDWLKLTIGKREHVAQLHNALAWQDKTYDFYMPINDDVTFITHGWDQVLIDTIERNGGGWGIAYPDDSTGNYVHNLPTFGMLSGTIVRTLGHVYPLELKMLNGDNYLLDIGRAIGKLYYCPTAVIKHTPPGISDQAFVPADHRNSREFVIRDNKAYAEYIDNNLEKDVSKLFDAIVNSQTEVLK